MHVPLFALIITGAAVSSTTSTAVEVPHDDIDVFVDNNQRCKVNIPLDGDMSRIVEYSEENPEMVDYSIHQWCASHDIHLSDTCNQLRNYFLNFCFSDFFNAFVGPIYTIIFNDYMHNIQMRKTDSHMNVTIDRFCSSYSPSIDHLSHECMQMKNTFMTDGSFLPSEESLSPLSSSLLETLYQRALSQPSDVQDHIVDHFQLAQECEVILEIGVRGMVSTWGMLWGLTNNHKAVKRYIGIDLQYPSGETWQQYKQSCHESQVDCVFLAQNDLSLSMVDIGPVDMMFIDALHTYCHVFYELTTFHKHVRKYITLHDTSPPWGEEDEAYSGDYSEYPDWFDKTKRGVFTAVLDFLARHSDEWVLLLRKETDCGYTVLERVSE
jgi:hypothetical protein